MQNASSDIKLTSFKGQGCCNLVPKIKMRRLQPIDRSSSVVRCLPSLSSVPFIVSSPSVLAIVEHLTDVTSGFHNHLTSGFISCLTIFI
ncbi:hypothetical protein Nepgr_029635 [Nepenthes gracilis]|uniref:Uncharacterized protein n=1 Tax=Nepenthes gracilis TaxID=150966 RepID=A0AAD3Y365_NEPGR|nr:hypothetical protein Nepgr_029635 [Nepenthes gracilis]